MSILLHLSMLMACKIHFHITNFQLWRRGQKKTILNRGANPRTTACIIETRRLQGLQPLDTWCTSGPHKVRGLWPKYSKVLLPEYLSRIRALWGTLKPNTATFR